MDGMRNILAQMVTERKMEAAAETPRQRQQRLMQEYSDEKGYPMDAVLRWFDYNCKHGWKDSRGEKIRNWKASLDGWMWRRNIR